MPKGRTGRTRATLLASVMAARTGAAKTGSADAGTRGEPSSLGNGGHE